MRSIRRLPLALLAVWATGCGGKRNHDDNRDDNREGFQQEEPVIGEKLEHGQTAMPTLFFSSTRSAR